VVDAVIVWALDRLHRRPAELERFFEVCDRAGVTRLASVAGELLRSIAADWNTRQVRPPTGPRRGWRVPGPRGRALGGLADRGDPDVADELHCYSSRVITTKTVEFDMAETVRTSQPSATALSRYLATL